MISERHCGLPTACYVAALLLAALQLSACRSPTDFRTYRLGSAVGSAIANRESRPVPANDDLGAIPLDLDPGCRLRVPLANLSKTSTLTFRVLGAGLGDQERLLAELQTERTWGWQELEFDLPVPPPDTLRLQVDGDQDDEALWGQPLATCPLLDDVPPANNVILISLDTLRADRLGVYGNRRNLAPNLDGLARQGALFTQAWSPFPNTLAAHASLFTGLTPQQHGLLPGVDSRMPRDTRTLARAFAEQGYHTVAFTENAFVSSVYGFDVGFDRYHNGPVVSEDDLFPGASAVTFGKAAGWLKNRPPGPFFLFVHTYDVHAPYSRPSGDLGDLLMYRLSPNYQGEFKQIYHPWSEIAHNAGQIPLLPRDLVRIESLYDAETWILDRQLGEFLRTLDVLDLVDSTLLVVISDHGEEFNEHGYMGHGETLHTQALHVPLLLRLPGRVPAGLRVSAPVNLLDAGPTMASLAGIPPPFSNVPALDLGPLLESPKLDLGQPVFSELNRSMGACKLSSPADFDIWKMAGMDCSYDGVALRDTRYTYIESAVTDAGQLFDRELDPGEFHDIAASKPGLVAAYHDKVSAYRRRNDEYKTETVPTKMDPVTHEKLRALGYIQ